MNSAVRKRLLGAWLVLGAITLGYLAIDHADDHPPSASDAITLAAIGIALLKIRIIMREFMGVRHAPRWLCRVTDAWIVIMAVGLVACYFIGKVVSG